MKIYLTESPEYYIAGLEEPYIDPFDMVGASGKYWFPEIDAWCTKTFGPSDFWGEPVVTGWKRMFGKYYFSSKEQRELFILRWS